MPGSRAASKTAPGRPHRSERLAAGPGIRFLSPAGASTAILLTKRATSRGRARRRIGGETFMRARHYPLTSGSSNCLRGLAQPHCQVGCAAPRLAAGHRDHPGSARRGSLQRAPGGACSAEPGFGLNGLRRGRARRARADPGARRRSMTEPPCSERRSLQPGRTEAGVYYVERRCRANSGASA